MLNVTFQNPVHNFPFLIHRTGHANVVRVPICKMHPMQCLREINNSKGEKDYFLASPFHFFFALTELQEGILKLTLK